MAGNSSSRKGAAFERELAKHFDEKLNHTVLRSLYTGDPMVRKGKGNSDLIGLPQLAVEAKRVEALSFPDAMRQAKRNAQGDERPVVVNRRNRQSIDESYVLLELSDFIEFYRAWGITQGYFKPTEDTP